MVTNAEIVSLLDELARLTTLEDGSPQSFRVRAYEAAARTVEGLAQPLAEMSEAEIAALRGLGQSTARKVRELVETGRIAKLDRLRAEFPPAFRELTRVPGIGPKTALLLRDRLGVRSVDDLKAAIDEQALRTVPGLGPKSEANIARALERLDLGGKERRAPVAEALRVAGDVVAALGALPEVERAEAMGSLRRFRETIGDVDVVVVSRGDPEQVMARFVALPMAVEVLAAGAAKSAILTSAGLQVDLRVVEPHQYGSAALYFTGSKAHNIRLRQLAIERGWTLSEYGLAEAESGRVLASATEEEIYAALGLQWVPPEMREDGGEIELAAAGALPRFIEEGDLRGDLHMHTDLSGDGREPLEAMVAAAAARGYEYLAITDHGEDMATNGVSREAMLAQRERLAGLRELYPGMLLLHGVELNIGRDGSVDYDTEFLAGFDWAVAGVHSDFDLDRETQTLRIVTAMQNPAVRVIAHPGGRIIGRRPGMDLDLEAVLSAAEETGTALEINGSLDRLDAPVEMLRACRGREVLLLVGSDAHHSRELANVDWGVRHARRGWVEPERVANTWPRERFLEWVRR
ncbi:MAG: DNA polymerase/3'-5' exonuclease PolX [Acidimicrobiia bacterium]|nr:DNA polymerase/3'-5' exonuclease PolX [Acidimicrobiia bacterium]